ncbi:hypothetical protein [Cytobacillus sp. FSL R5-0596]|uniref:hypothetical protein n=1 Tax=Cytobacillus sp. FSL R5-0596 TaxID=2954696 RepID=UPI0030FCCA2B
MKKLKHEIENTTKLETNYLKMENEALKNNVALTADAWRDEIERRRKVQRELVSIEADYKNMKNGIKSVLEHIENPSEDDCEESMIRSIESFLRYLLEDEGFEKQNSQS